MADITSQVTIENGAASSYDITNVPEWRSWQITIPAALISTTNNDIRIAGFPNAGTRLLDVRGQINQVTNSGTSATLIVQSKLEVIATGAQSAVSSLVTMSALATETDGFPLGGSGIGAFGEGMTEGVNQRVLTLDVTGAGTQATEDCIVTVAALLFRADL